MEEFLKNKAEELDYLINEREKIDNKSRKTAKDKEELEAISNLIKQLSEQLSKEEIKDTSKELADWNMERIELDTKTKKNKRDKSDIKEINEILKSLSEKLKEMSSQKEIEEYEAEKEASEQQLNDYSKQLEALNALEQTLAPTAYNLAIEEIKKLIEQENQILSYNERIISTYNLLKENNYKLNIISKIEEQTELKKFYSEQIPSNLLEDPTHQEEYENQIREDETEVKKLSKYLNELKELQKDRKEHYDFNEVEKIQEEINSVEKHLNPLQSRLEQNEQIISNYLNLKEIDHEIALLSSNLSATDSKENVSIIIENCKRILPENLQKSATVMNAEDYYLDEEVTKEELDADLKSIEEKDTQELNNRTQRSELESALDDVLLNKSSSETNTTNFSRINVNSDKDNKTNQDENEGKEENEDKININFEKGKDAVEKIKEVSLNFKMQNDQAKLNNSSQKSILESALEDVLSNKNKSSSDNLEETKEKNTTSKNGELKSKLFEAEQSNPKTENKTEQSNPKSETKSEEHLNENSYEEIPPIYYSAPLQPGQKASLKKSSNEKEVTGVRKAFKNIKNILTTRKTIIATTLVLLAVGIVPKGVNSAKNLEKYKKGDPNAISVVNETDQVIDDAINELESETNEIDILTENSTEKDYTYETEPISEVKETDLISEIETVQQSKTKNSDVPKKTESDKAVQNETEEQLIKELEAEKNKTSMTDGTNHQNTDSLNTISFLKYLNSDLKSNQFETKENLENLKEQTDEVLKDAFYNSNLRTNVAQDEYAAENRNWNGIKEENYDYWTDAPLKFVKDPNELGKDVYLVQQPDENGVLTGMYWTDEETMNNYNNSLEESIEQIMNKGRGSK